MKTILLISFLLICCMPVLKAHSASMVELEYERETNILKVSFIHKVTNIEEHFIDEVVVQLNEETIIEQTVNQQENNDGGIFFYKIPGLKSGDKLKAITNCNRIGKKSAELEID